MPHSCTNLCEREDFKKEYNVIYGLGGKVKGVKRNESNKDDRKYLNGYKRCQLCYYYTTTKKVRCPCCSYIYRVSRKRTTARPTYEHEKTYKNLIGHRLSMESDILLNKDKWDNILNTPKRVKTKCPVPTSANSSDLYLVKAMSQDIQRQENAARIVWFG